MSVRKVVQYNSQQWHELVEQGWFTAETYDESVGDGGRSRRMAVMLRKQGDRYWRMTDAERAALRRFNQR